MLKGEYEKNAFIDQDRRPSRKGYQVHDYDDSFWMKQCHYCECSLK